MNPIAVVNIDMLTTMGVAALAIYLGNFLRKQFPILKKYCLPASVVGGTIFALITYFLYARGICEIKFDYRTTNTLFYNLFFAACGAGASMALLKKGGKLVFIFVILAAVTAILQNVISVGIGQAMGINPLVALMTGSIPMTGGHGNAGSFAPAALESMTKLANAANLAPDKLATLLKEIAPLREVALASATFGLISGCLFGGPMGDFMVKKNHLQDPQLDGKSDAESGNVEEQIPIYKNRVIQAVLLLCLASGVGAVIFKGYNVMRALPAFSFLKSLAIPIHVWCMLGGLIARLVLDKMPNKDNESFYEAIDTVGEFSLAIFVSLSIITMQFWQLSGLGIAMTAMLLAQLIFMLLFAYFLTFKLLGKNYDAAVMAVGHIGFGLGAVPVSMTTMETVCTKYRYSKLAFFVVPVVGGFISNLTNAAAISWFISFCSELVLKRFGG